MKRIVSVLLSLLIFCSVFLGTNISSNAASVLMSGGKFVSVNSKGQIVDSITTNGVKVDAIFRPFTGDNGTDSTYSCAAFVSKYYSNVYGVSVSNLWSISSTPVVSKNSFVKSSTPVVGDIIRDNVSVHWAIVKSVDSSGTITVIQQNAWNEERTKAWVGAKIYKGNSRYTYFHYTGSTTKNYTISYNANGGTGSIASQKIAGNSNFTVKSCTFTKSGYYFSGYNVYRKSDATWYVSGTGWRNTENIRTNGYNKKIYKDGQTYTLDSSWTTGASSSETYVFYPIWKPNNPTVEFYGNYSGANYILGGNLDSTFLNYFGTRDKSIYSLSVDKNQCFNNQNSLKVVGNSAGSTGKDIYLLTDTNNGLAEVGKSGDNKKMTLSFFAKATVSGAKAYIRWGYGTSNKTVSLTTSWKKYTLDLTKNQYHGSYIHIYFDKAGTYYFNTMVLCDGTGATIITPETSNVIATNTYSKNGTYSTLPIPTRKGYIFDGWYTAKNGGTRITTSTKVNALNTKVYAHWIKDISYEPIYTVNTVEGKTYELYDNAMDWNSAKQFCEDKGGHLVTINSKEENDLVTNMISDKIQYCWIGASYNTSNNNWEWVTGEPFNYTNWIEGQPSNSTSAPEYYIQLTGFDMDGKKITGKWNDAMGVNSWISFYARQRSLFVCEYEATESVNKTEIYLPTDNTVLYVKDTYKIDPEIINGNKDDTVYLSTNIFVATVDENGVITAKSSGTALISVINNGVCEVFKVTVKKPSLNKKSVTLKKGKSVTLKIKGQVGKAKFTTSNKKIATVNTNGVIKAKKKGTATITVNTNGIKLKCKVKVKK